MRTLQESILNKSKTKRNNVRTFEWYKSHVMFAFMELYEIEEGFKNGLTPEQIELYAQPEYESLQMMQIRLALCNGISEDKVKIMLNPKFDWVQMGIISDAFDEGLTIEQVKTFAKPNYSEKKMKKMKEELLGQL